MPTVSSSSRTRADASLPLASRAAPSARRSARRCASPGRRRSSRPGRPSRCPSSDAARRSALRARARPRRRADPARDGGGRRQQPHEREDRRRLPAARLAHHAEPRSRVDREGHALDGMELPAVREVEPDVEVVDLEQRGSRLAAAPAARSGRSTRKRRTDRWPVRRRGLSASSIVCPMIVQARTTNITQRPGGITAHQALLMIASSLKAFSIRLPHEIVLGSPSPRKVMKVSAKIAYAIRRTVFATRSGVTCGGRGGRSGASCRRRAPGLAARRPARGRSSSGRAGAAR